MYKNKRHKVSVYQKINNWQSTDADGREGAVFINFTIIIYNPLTKNTGKQVIVTPV